MSVPGVLQGSKDPKMGGKDTKDEAVTLDNLESTLSKDTRVKLAGVDVDGKICKVLH